jgi:hypothetical protein
MIGQRVESRRGLPWGALAFASIGLGLLAGGFALGQLPLFVVAALPLGISVALLMFGREPHFGAVFGETAIEVEGSYGSISYGSLRDVRAAGIPHDPSAFRKASAPIHLQHEGGILHIPHRLNVPSHEVYRFLASRIHPSGDRAVNSALAEYLERQEGYFGQDHIWTYRASRRPSRRGQYRRFRAICLGLVLAGLAWMVAGFSGFVDQGWGVAGIMCALIGLCFSLATLAQSSGPGQYIKNWKNASLVVGPQGMAMVQGDIQGEVRWPELLEIRFRPKANAFRLHYAQGLSGISLKVKGAEILIADIYDRPLYIIYDRILAASGRLAPEEIVDL